MAEVELSSVIKNLRNELNEALADSSNERLRFELGPIELTLSVVVAKEASPTAKVRIYVVEAGAGGKYSSSATQQVKLTLTLVDTAAAVDAEGRRESPLICGNSLPRER